MCDLCMSLGIGGSLKTEVPAQTGKLERNEDGTYTLTLTERQAQALAMRLAASVLLEQRL